jgi:hypothetical protein
MNSLILATDAGDIEIRKHELPSLTEAELKQHRISRQELRRCFAAGAKLMKSTTPSDRTRPVASETLDGKWEVRLVQ